MTSTLIVALCMLALVAGGLYMLQPSMVFLPSQEIETTPADWGLAYEEVSLDTSDGVRLHGWFVPRPDTRQVLLFFHGNAGNISHRRESVEIFHALGLNVLIIDYRGYGGSAGSPSEQGLYLDAVAAWNYLVEARGIEARNIVVFGRSLGGIVAAWLAARERPQALILESTLSSARDFIRAHYGAASWLIPSRYRFDTAALIPDVRCPVLVLHSAEDEIMPYSLGRKVHDAARSPKEFVTLRGDHNSGFIISQPGYSQALRSFLDRTLPTP